MPAARRCPSTPPTPRLLAPVCVTVEDAETRATSPPVMVDEAASRLRVGLAVAARQRPAR